MNRITLKPFVRENLDILFVGLNPAVISNQKGHYFSVKQSFWNQLYKSGLILKEVDKEYADECIFGDTVFNINQRNFGITDLVTNIANSNSTEVTPTINDCIQLERTILEYKPKVAIILHSKVLKIFIHKHLGLKKKYFSNCGNMGQLLRNSDTTFFNIAFPHGNAIPDAAKIERYKEVKEFILNRCITKLQQSVMNRLINNLLHFVFL